MTSIMTAYKPERFITTVPFKAFATPTYPEQFTGQVGQADCDEIYFANYVPDTCSTCMCSDLQAN